MTFPEGVQFADDGKVTAILDELMVRWSSLLDRLSTYDGPPRDEES